MQRVLYGVMAGVLCIAAAVAIVVVLSEESGYTTERLAYTAVAVLAFGLAAAGGVSLLDVGRLPWLGWLCVAVSAIGIAVFAAAVWSADQYESQDTGLWKAAYSLLITSFAVGYVSLLAKVEPGGRLVPAAQIAALALATLAVVAIVGQIGDETYFRWLGVVAVLWVLGTALIPIARRLRRPV
jgi:peptidoglycan/LPS O-acetylase OafA/YrhL